jgi:hypothetical protein
MIRVIAGLLPILYGIVHLLYFGHARRDFDAQPKLGWPDDSWAFSWLKPGMARTIAAMLCATVAVAFVGAGVGILGKLWWWRSMTIVAAGASIGVFVLFWDGKTDRIWLDGLAVVLADIALLVAAVAFRWPDLS